MATRSRGRVEDRGGGRFLVRAYLGAGPDGKRQYVSRMVRGTPKDANRVLTEMLREYDQGTLIRPSRETLGSYLERWLRDVAAIQVRKQSAVRYRKDLERYLIPKIGSRRLADLRSADIQAVYAQLVGRGLSAATIRGVHAALRRALNSAVKTGMLTRNVALVVELPRLQRKEMRAMAPDEVRSFLSHTAGDRYEAFFRFLLATGCRPGEAVGLRWQDVQDGSATINHSLVRDAKGWRLDEPKTSKSRRRIPLDVGTLRLLESHRRRQSEERIKAGPTYGNHGFVFATALGEPVNLRNVAQRHLKPALERAGLPKSIRLYDLRHTCATLMLVGREPVKVVSERLGHASSTLTTDVYQHVIEGLQEAATERLGVLLG